MSGGHVNPAVTVGLAVARRFSWSPVVPSVATQVVAATAAGGVLFAIATGKAGTTAAMVRASGFATNGYGDRPPGGYSVGAALLAEIVLTAAFVYVVLGATDDRAPKGFAPLAIGLALTLIHLIALPITNTLMNPARRLGGAWYAGGAALGQVWLFVLAPVAGAVVAGASHARLTGADGRSRATSGSPTTLPSTWPARSRTPSPATRLSTTTSRLTSATRAAPLVGDRFLTRRPSR